LLRCGHPWERAPTGSAAAIHRADATAYGATAPVHADRGCDRGGIHDSGNRPIINNSRRCLASARSLFARCLLLRLPAVCAGSARCTTAPTRRSSSTTNRQPVMASSATSSSRPPNCCATGEHRPGAQARSACATPPRCRCRTTPRGLLKLHGSQTARTSSAPELRRSLQASPDSPPAHAIYQVTPVILGRDARHNQSHVRRQPVNSDIASQPATVREPNRPAGRRRFKALGSH